LDLIVQCLSPNICGNDIPPDHIVKKIKPFLATIIKKISETNLRTRDNSINTLIKIFHHPALNVGDLIKTCLDIIENKDSPTPDKLPHPLLLARLEIVLHVLEEYGINEGLWDWYPVLIDLIIPSLFHQNPECRMVAIANIILLYKSVGDDIKNIIGGLTELKLNIKEHIVNKMIDVDNINKKNNDALLESNYNKISNQVSNRNKNSNQISLRNSGYESIKEEDHDDEIDNKSRKNTNLSKQSNLNQNQGQTQGQGQGQGQWIGNNSINNSGQTSNNSNNNLKATNQSIKNSQNQNSSNANSVPNNNINQNYNNNQNVLSSQKSSNSNLNNQNSNLDKSSLNSKSNNK
jgi:centrosomal protein CEP104